MVVKVPPVPGRNSPSMNSPYSSRRFRIDRDSGAGAYSRKLIVRSSVDRHVVGAGVVAGCQLLPLAQHVVEQAGCAVTEQVGLQPFLPRRLGDGDEVLHGILRGADAA